MVAGAHVPDGLVFCSSWRTRWRLPPTIKVELILCCLSSYPITTVSNRCPFLFAISFASTCNFLSFSEECVARVREVSEGFQEVYLDDQPPDQPVNVHLLPYPIQVLLSDHRKKWLFHLTGRHNVLLWQQKLQKIWTEKSWVWRLCSGWIGWSSNCLGRVGTLSWLAGACSTLSF